MHKWCRIRPPPSTLFVNNALVALQRSGDHEFGVKDMTVYGDHSTSMDAEEVIDFFLERDVALNATATAGEGVKITGVKNNYMAAKRGIYLEDGEILRSCERNGERRSDYSFRREIFVHTARKCDFRQHRSDDDADRRGV